MGIHISINSLRFDQRYMEKNVTKKSVVIRLIRVIHVPL